jgi:hypothetical protein
LRTGKLLAGGAVLLDQYLAQALLERLNLQVRVLQFLFLVAKLGLQLPITSSTKAAGTDTVEGWEDALTMLLEYQIMPWIDKP